MMRTIIVLASLFYVCGVSAEQWEFSEKTMVSPHYGKKIFHHIDSAGKKNIAVSGNSIAIVWEDNHKGASQAYVAFRDDNKNNFTYPQQISKGQYAYEPVVIPLKSNTFIMGWEQDDHVWVRCGSTEQLNPAIKLGKGRQLSLYKNSESEVVAAWIQPVNRFGQVVTTILDVNSSNKISVSKIQAIEQQAPVNEQLYPVIAGGKNGVTIVWEDRRDGHTKLLYSHRNLQGQFTAPQVLNEVVQKSRKFGRGSGVTRASVTNYKDNKIAATWMDKRGFRTGYDIYAAFSDKTGMPFGKNQQVQDMFGDNISQWNPVITGNTQGDVVVAWDDDRDETPDIWLSWKTDQGWSDDFLLEPAAGEGIQTNPAIALDDDRNLHVIWLEKHEPHGPSKFYYTVGNKKE